MVCRAHIGYKETGIFYKGSLCFVPRVGDVLRLNGPKYVKVIEVCWCLDEYAPGLEQRVNISVEDEK